MPRDCRDDNRRLRGNSRFELKSNNDVLSPLVRDPLQTKLAKATRDIRTERTPYRKTYKQKKDS